MEKFLYSSSNPTKNMFLQNLEKSVFSLRTQKMFEKCTQASQGSLCHHHVDSLKELMFDAYMQRKSDKDYTDLFEIKNHIEQLHGEFKEAPYEIKLDIDELQKNLNDIDKIVKNEVCSTCGMPNDD